MNSNMTARYDFFRTPQPKDPGKVRYHARLVVGERITTEQLARRIADRCSLSTGDVKAALTELSEVLESEIRSGNSVQVEGLGTFRGSAKSPSVRSVKEVRAENIHFGGIVYSPDRKLEHSLKSMGFKRVEHTHRSQTLSEQEIDNLLADYFQSHESITTRAMCALCGLRPATALRRLQKRVAEGRLTHPGYRRAPFYYPVAGHFCTGQRTMED